MGLPLPPISFPADGRSSSMACHALWRTSTHMVNGWLFPQNHWEDPWILLGYLLYLLGNNEGFRYFLDGSSFEITIFWMIEIHSRQWLGGWTWMDDSHDYTPWQDIVKRGNNQATLASTWEWWRGWNHTGSGYNNYNIFTVASLEMFTIYFRKGSLSQNTVSSGWWLVHYYNLARMDLTWFNNQAWVFFFVWSLNLQWYLKETGHFMEQTFCSGRARGCWLHASTDMHKSLFSLLTHQFY